MINEKIFWNDRVKKYGKLSTGYLNDEFYLYDDQLRWYLFRKYGKVKKGSKVLDVGCNHGKWSYKLNDLGMNVTGFDISDEAIKLANSNKKKRDIKFFSSKVKDLNLEKDQFDLIVSVTVLQHILKEDEFKESLEKLIEVTKKGGKIFLIESIPFKKKKSKLDYKREWTFESFNKIFSKKCSLKKIRGIDFLGYYTFVFFEIFLSKSKIRRVLEPFFLKIAKPIDKMLVNMSFFTRFSNTKMIIYVKK